MSLFSYLHWHQLSLISTSTHPPEECSRMSTGGLQGQQSGGKGLLRIAWEELMESYASPQFCLGTPPFSALFCVVVALPGFQFLEAVDCAPFLPPFLSGSSLTQEYHPSLDSRLYLLLPWPICGLPTHLCPGGILPDPPCDSPSSSTLHAPSGLRPTLRRSLQSSLIPSGLA